MSCKCSEFTAGKLNRRIALYAKVLTPDGCGGGTTVPTLQQEAWANIKPSRGSERFFAEKIEAPETTRFVIRYVTTIIENQDESWYILYKGITYNIRSIFDVEEAHRFIEIHAERGVAP